MRIVVDSERCTGHGRCSVLAPDVYDADDVGRCAPRFEEIPTELEHQALQGARNCPEGAIRLEGEPSAAPPS